MQKKRSGWKVMLGLIGMVRPLMGIMALAITMGCIGNLMASFITILGGYGLLSVLGTYQGMPLGRIFGLIVAFAVLRGVLRYTEQASNHYIAFKLLARIRHQVFASLRKLAPAKLDGSEKGNLISIITSDIELLEVFYAHTISPIAIAVITSVIMTCYIGSMNWRLGVLAMLCYLLVGAVIPIVNSRLGSEKGGNYREAFGKLNSIVLDNLYGSEEIRQYQQTKKRGADMAGYTLNLEKIARKLKNLENVQRVATDSVILIAGIAMLILSGVEVSNGRMDFNQTVIATIAMMSSFGPVAALSALSNNLNQTLASGNRVLNLLEEEPVVEDILTGETECSGDIVCEKICFTYPDAAGNEDENDKPESAVLKDFSRTFQEHKIHGILGRSGCGKSTLLKLLMRFYEANLGRIAYGNHNVNEIETHALRRQIAYVTQETFIFNDSVKNNILVARADATDEEVMEAAKKASIHDFIMTLPNGYDTRVGEAGDSLSGGEKQRIGIARAFLHDSSVIFLDEPTSNIDSLNEGMILKSLEEEKRNKTILLVSHRKSTMGIADEVYAYPE